MRSTRWLLVACLFLQPAAPLSAIEPREVFLLVNKNVPASADVAEHYCKVRGIPKENVLVLDLPGGEDINRHEYDTKLAAPLRDLLKGKRDQAKVLVSTYGVPLRVGHLQMTEKEKAQDDQFVAKTAEYQAKVKEWQEQLKKESDAAAAQKLRDDIKAAETQIKGLQTQHRWISDGESAAAVDSELMLLWWEKYELRRWQKNTLYWQVSAEDRAAKPTVVMTSRLDGPSPELVKKLIDTSVAVEKKGLAGKVYVDARGIKYVPGKSSTTGYEGYDESMREMARLLEKAKLDVTLDDRLELFAPGSCPDCALYCGWYSHANYIDCCKFAPGAVAWHLASSEAVTLRDPKCKYWCKNLLDNGVVATLGPVAEPYTIGFPKPAEFFGFLATGEFTLVECYSRTILFNSWMTTLVGDPLYNPYRATPKLKAADVRPSPATEAK
jgi:uncharacterized protein (TIGR03790 family)